MHLNKLPGSFGLLKDVSLPGHCQRQEALPVSSTRHSKL